MQPPQPKPAPHSARITLYPFKMRVLRILLILGSAALVIIWAFESCSGLITLIDRVAYPSMIAIFLTSLVALLARPRMLPIIEWVCFSAFAAYVIASFFHIILDIGPHISLYNVATLVQWLPMIYIAAFIFFSTRHAMSMSALIYLVFLTAILAHFFIAGPISSPSEAYSILLNMLWAHPIYIATLTSVAWLKANFIEARANASVMSTAANVDYLTGVDNRRATAHVLQQALAEAQASGAGLSVLLLDIDHFKQVNDRFGHDVGDHVLVDLAAALRDQLRAADTLGRWGGEEFIIIARQIRLPEAASLAERLRACAEQLALPEATPITLSFGVAAARPADTPESLVKRADEALYRAKQRGRNRVEWDSL
jgi:diguanylate cyclase